MNSDLIGTTERMSGSLGELAASLREMGISESAAWAEQIADTLLKAAQAETTRRETEADANATPQPPAQPLAARMRAANISAPGAAPVAPSPDETLDRGRLASVAAEMRRLRRGMVDGSR